MDKVTKDNEILKELVYKTDERVSSNEWSKVIWTFHFI